jgi:outer membrane lipoprotein SlyB
VIKLVVGILKGAVIGGAVGYGAFALGTATGFDSPWLTYGVIGALVGLIAGRSFWSLLRDKNATTWVAILKSAFGFGIGCGLYALIAKAWNPSALVVGGYDIFTWPVTLGGAIGAVYGGFVELDDAIGDDKKPAAATAKDALATSATAKPTKPTTKT